MKALPESMTVFERDWLSSNNVLFTSGEGSAIVDTGYASHAPQTLALVTEFAQDRPLLMRRRDLPMGGYGSSMDMNCRWLTRLTCQ